MKPSVEQLQGLLALKRHETPEEGYMEDFLVEFHGRRRRDLAETSGVSARLDRMGEWFSNLGASRKIYAAGLAYAGVVAGLLLAPHDNPEPQAPVVPVKNEVIPSSAQDKAQQLNSLDLSPSAKGSTGEQEF